MYDRYHTDFLERFIGIFAAYRAIWDAKETKRNGTPLLYQDRLVLFTECKSPFIVQVNQVYVIVSNSRAHRDYKDIRHKKR